MQNMPFLLPVKFTLRGRDGCARNDGRTKLVERQAGEQFHTNRIPGRVSTHNLDGIAF